MAIVAAMEGGRSRGRLTLAALLTLATAAVPATGVASANASAPVGVPAGHFSAAQASRFWTPARMRSARPLEVEGPAAGAAQAAAARFARRSWHAFAGQPRRIPGRAATAEPFATPSLASHAGPPRPVAPGADFIEVPDPTSAASRVNGVIFIEEEGGLARCSGTSVNAPNMSVVFTAGHCVHDVSGHRGHWYTGRWTFVPGYRFGQRPFGVFPARWLDSTKVWVKTGNENFDVAAAVVGRNERGQRLAAAVGATGIAFGLPPKQKFDVHGYPVGLPFNGETQRLCTATPFLGHDPGSFLSPGPLNLAVGCKVTGGASGGGWTLPDGSLNSVTDYGYPEDPESDFGAYFGREVAALYHRVANFK